MSQSVTADVKRGLIYALAGTDTLFRDRPLY